MVNIDIKMKVVEMGNIIDQYTFHFSLAINATLYYQISKTYLLSNSHFSMHLMPITPKIPIFSCYKTMFKTNKLKKYISSILISPL